MRLQVPLASIILSDKARRIAHLFLLLPWFMLCPGTASAAPSCPPESGIALQVLGSGGPVADDARASASYLVWVDGVSRALIDIGGGAFLRFGESGAAFDELDFIGLSHFHTDHSADLPALLKSGYFSDRIRALPVAGPGPGGPFPGVDEFIDGLFNPKTGVYRYLSGYLDGTDGLVELETIEVSPETRFSDKVTVLDGDRLVIEAMGIPHGIVPSLAYRLTIDDTSLVFGGDQNGSESSFEDFARGADVLVMHMAIPENAGDIAMKLHPKPSEIGAIAKSAGVKTLLLSHFMARSLREKSKNVDTVREHFKGRVVTANDLRCLVL